MKKRSLKLDREVLTESAAPQVHGGATWASGAICFACDYVLTRLIDATIDSLGSDCCGGPGGDEGTDTCTETAAAPSCQTIC